MIVVIKSTDLLAESLPAIITTCMFSCCFFKSNFSELSRSFPISHVTNTIRNCDPMCQIRKISSLFGILDHKVDDEISGLIRTFPIVIFFIFFYFCFPFGFCFWFWFCFCFLLCLSFCF